MPPTPVTKSEPLPETNSGRGLYSSICHAKKASANSYGAWTSPAPTLLAGNGSGFAVASSFLHRFMPRRLGEVCAHNAAQPATCGVAMLVPLIVRSFVGLGQDEKTSRPGAAISIFPILEKFEGLRF